MKVNSMGPQPPGRPPIFLGLVEFLDLPRVEVSTTVVIQGERLSMSTSGVGGPSGPISRHNKTRKPRKSRGRGLRTTTGW